MKWIIIALPAVGLVGSALAMLAYPIRAGTHEQIVEDLAHRAAQLQPAEFLVE